MMLLRTVAALLLFAALTECDRDLRCGGGAGRKLPKHEDELCTGGAAGNRVRLAWTYDEASDKCTRTSYCDDTQQPPNTFDTLEKCFDTCSVAAAGGATAPSSEPTTTGEPETGSSTQTSATPTTTSSNQTETMARIKTMVYDTIRTTQTVTQTDKLTTTMETATTTETTTIESTKPTKTSSTTESAATTIFTAMSESTTSTSTPEPTTPTTTHSVHTQCGKRRCNPDEICVHIFSVSFCHKARGCGANEQYWPGGVKCRQRWYCGDAPPAASTSGVAIRCMRLHLPRCICKADYVWHFDDTVGGTCVRVDQCPAAANTAGGTSDTRRADRATSRRRCGENEHYEECGYCETTCDQAFYPFPATCSRKCHIGCRCDAGYTRMRKGDKCIPTEACPHNCGERQEFNECSTSDQVLTCGDVLSGVHKECARGEQCKPRCLCQQGYVWNTSLPVAQCVEKTECRRSHHDTYYAHQYDTAHYANRHRQPRPKFFMQRRAYQKPHWARKRILRSAAEAESAETSSGDIGLGPCGAHQTLGYANCRRTCARPRHSCPTRVGIPGCTCLKGYVWRDKSYKECVKKEDCGKKAA